MPSVKLPRKSTDTDMTPFVDIAFLILSFFIMATKFKPPETVSITTPGSVSAENIPEDNAVMISIDSTGRVFFTVLAKTTDKHDAIIKGINSSQSLGLSPAEIQNFRNTYMVGVPFGGLKQLLGTEVKEQGSLKQTGIPVLDSTNNQLTWWIREAKIAFAGSRGFRYLIKGDAQSKYPVFEAVMAALKKNEEYKYYLISSLEGAPAGSDLDKTKFFKPQGK
jgi:biopolymer transport protein ExbD